MNKSEFKKWNQSRNGGRRLRIEKAQTKDELAKILADNRHHLVAIPFGKDMDMAMWSEYVGANNANIYFDYEEHTAYVFFNIETIATADMVDAGQAIIDLLQQGYTQKTLAEALGVNEMTISRVKGRRNEHYDTRLQLNLRANKLLREYK